MSSYEELFHQINPGESTENITNAFRTLLDCVSAVKHSIPQCSNSNIGSSNYGRSSNFNNSNTQSPNDDSPFTSDQFDKVKKAFSNFNELVKKNFERSLDNIFNTPGQAPWDSFTTKQIQVKLSALENLVMKLRFHIPSLRTELSSTSSDVRRYTWKEWSNRSPNSHMNDEILQRSDLTELEDAFKELNSKLKLCLLCFAVVPENAVVKRRLLIDWWIGERLLDSPATEGMAAEEHADEILMELIAEGFIERVKRRQKLITDRFKMQPVVRSLVIEVAKEEGFFDFNFKGNSTASSWRCSRFCLTDAKDGASEQVLSDSPDDFDLEKLRTVFNINEPFPDSGLESLSKAKHLNIVDCFSKMKNVNVLYLGRWQSSGEHHIEVESINFLKGLKNMKCLRLLSLQGISRINELPKSVGKLTNLRILDLKACHNLEALPAEIALLKQLTRLDISECFLLDGVPKGIASLSKLEVLKGFLIGNLESESSCTLESLIGLKKLRNLSISTSSKAFPTEEELYALNGLEALQKLGIAWGMKQQNRASKLTRLLTKRIRNGEPELPAKLEKLKLQSLPHKITPYWLIPGKLKSLKTLLIRGGELANLGLEGNDKWTVEILHLRYLFEFEMDWKKLQKSFPNLIFLEKVNCPKLTSYPCDDKYGVWLKH